MVMLDIFQTRRVGAVDSSFSIPIHPRFPTSSISLTNFNGIYRDIEIRIIQIIVMVNKYNVNILKVGIFSMKKILEWNLIKV